MRSLLILVAALMLAFGCSGADANARKDPLAALRRAGEGSNDGEAVGRWLLGELFAPGGGATRATAARKRLDSIAPRPDGMYASLARAVDDEAHGHFQSAAPAHLAALTAARSDAGPDAALVAWYAANHLLGLRSSVANLWDKAKGPVVAALDHPGNI